MALEMTGTLEYIEKRIRLWHTSGRPAEAAGKAAVTQPQAPSPAPSAAEPATAESGAEGEPAPQELSPVEQRCARAGRQLLRYHVEMSVGRLGSYVLYIFNFGLI